MTSGEPTTISSVGFARADNAKIVLMHGRRPLATGLIVDWNSQGVRTFKEALLRHPLPFHPQKEKGKLIIKKSKAGELRNLLFRFHKSLKPFSCQSRGYSLPDLSNL